VFLFEDIFKAIPAEVTSLLTQVHGYGQEKKQILPTIKTAALVPLELITPQTIVAAGEQVPDIQKIKDNLAMKKMAI